MPHAPMNRSFVPEANGFKSRDEIKLKTSATIYEVGTAVVAEQFLLAPTSALTKAINDDTTNYPTKKVSLVLHRTDASEGHTDAAGFSRDGVVKPSNIDVPVNLTLDDLVTLFAAQDVLYPDNFLF